MSTRPVVRASGAVVAIALAVAACSGAGEPADSAAPSVPTSVPPTLAPSGFLDAEEMPPPPDLDKDRILAGAVRYQMKCAECHKADLSGERDWMIPNDDGTYKPPPHDSTGHTWHHDDQLLLEIIRDGSPDPSVVMAPFGEILTDEQILDILQFFKSQWGDNERTFQWEVTWRAEQGDS